jgi:hypothetical protein
VVDQEEDQVVDQVEDQVVDQVEDQLREEEPLKQQPRQMEDLECQLQVQ